MRNRKGFTLFELLAVMIVISMILGVAIPAFRYYQKKAVEAGAEGDIKLLAAALKVYHFNHKKYPSQKYYQEELIRSVPRLIDKPLYDPFSQVKMGQYIFKLSKDGKYFILYSVGVLGNVDASVSDSGKVVFLRGDPKAEKWASNGSLP